MQFPPPDTPEQVTEATRLGLVRTIEIDGRGMWRDSSHTSEWVGAANAIAATKGEPPPYPANPLMPWLG